MSSEPKDPEADRPIVDDPAHLFGDGAANDDDFDLRRSDEVDPTPLEQQEDEVGPSTEDSEWVQEVRFPFRPLFSLRVGRTRFISFADSPTDVVPTSLSFLRRFVQDKPIQQDEPSDLPELGLPVSLPAPDPLRPAVPSSPAATTEAPPPLASPTVDEPERTTDSLFLDETLQEDDLFGPPEPASIDSTSGPDLALPPAPSSPSVEDLLQVAPIVEASDSTTDSLFQNEPVQQDELSGLFKPAPSDSPPGPDDFLPDLTLPVVPSSSDVKTETPTPAVPSVDAPESTMETLFRDEPVEEEDLFSSAEPASTADSSPAMDLPAVLSPPVVSVEDPLEATPSVQELDSTPNSLFPDEPVPENDLFSPSEPVPADSTPASELALPAVPSPSAPSVEALPEADPSVEAPGSTIDSLFQDEPVQDDLFGAPEPDVAASAPAPDLPLLSVPSSTSVEAPSQNVPSTDAPASTIDSLFYDEADDPFGDINPAPQAEWPAVPASRVMSRERSLQVPSSPASPAGHRSESDLRRSPEPSPSKQTATSLEASIKGVPARSQSANPYAASTAAVESPTKPALKKTVTTNPYATANPWATTANTPVPASSPSITSSNPYASPATSNPYAGIARSQSPYSAVSSNPYSAPALPSANPYLAQASTNPYGQAASPSRYQAQQSLKPAAPPPLPAVLSRSNTGKSAFDPPDLPSIPVRRARSSTPLQQTPYGATPSPFGTPHATPPAAVAAPPGPPRRLDSYQPPAPRARVLSPPPPPPPPAEPPRATASPYQGMAAHPPPPPRTVISPPPKTFQAFVPPPARPPSAGQMRPAQPPQAPAYSSYVAPPAARTSSPQMPTAPAPASGYGTYGAPSSAEEPEQVAQPTQETFAQPQYGQYAAEQQSVPAQRSYGYHGRQQSIDGAISDRGSLDIIRESHSTSLRPSIVRIVVDSPSTPPWITDGAYGNYQQPPPPPRTKSAASSRAFAATPPPPSAYQAPPPRPSSASSNRSSYSQSHYGAVPPPAPFTAPETAYSVEDPYARSTGPSPPPRPPSASAGRPVRAPVPGSSTSLSPLVANRPLPPQRALSSTSTAYGPPAGLPPASNGYAPYESTEGQASYPPSSYSGLPPSAPFSHPVQAPPLGSYVPAIVQAVSEDPLGRGGEKFKKVPVINFGFGGRLLVCYPELGTANQYGGFGAGESEVEGDGRTVRLLKLSEILTEGCKSTLLFRFLISDD